MKSKVRLWLLLIPVALVAMVGGWLLMNPRPPDFTRRGFVSVRAVFPMYGPTTLTASSDQPVVVAKLADILRSGQPVDECKCGDLGRIEFLHSDGAVESVSIVPPHVEGTIEFRAGRQRFWVDRAQFLNAVKPFGVPDARWLRRPDWE